MNREELKKVLFIAYIYPPLSGAGVHRTVKFVKYLRQNNWIPVVLSTSNTDWPNYDPSNYRNEVPSEVKIFRTPCYSLVVLVRVFFRFARRISQGFRKLFQLVGLELKLSILRRRIGFLERCERAIANFLTIPDDRIGWFFSAFPKAVRIVLSDNIRVVYTTSSPYSAHLIGFALRAITRKPWVADFRDAWTDNAIFNEGKPEWVKRVHVRLEKRILRRADKVIAVSDSIVRGFLEKHESINPEKFVVIPNGFDPSDFEKIIPFTSDKFVISYIGELYASRSPEVMLEAYARFVQHIQRESVLFRIIGWKDENSKKFIEDIIAQYDLEDALELHGQLSHSEALRYMTGSDLLIFILGANETGSGGVCPGKIFEYLASRKPILGITPPGEAANLVRDLKAGFICDNKDVDCIQQVFLRCYRAHLKNEKIYSLNGDIGKYDRKTLTQELAKVLDSVSK